MKQSLYWIFFFVIVILNCTSIEEPKITLQSKPIITHTQQLYHNIPANWKTILGIPVLCYHWVFPTDAIIKNENNTIAVTSKQFHDQMKWLFDNGYHTISIDALFEYITTGQILWKENTKPIIITFDDGNKVHLKYALDILSKFGFRSVEFAIPYYVGKTSRGMNWNELNELQNKGSSVESHSYTHPYLSSMTLSKQENEFIKSKSLLKEKLNKKIQYLAYPYGLYNSFTLSSLQKSNFIAAFTVFDGDNIPGINPYYLNRYMIRYKENLNDFSRYVKRKGLPIIELSILPGEQIKSGQILKGVLPIGLNIENLKVSFNSQKINYIYDFQTGSFQMKFPMIRERHNFIKFVYLENSVEYYTRFLYLN